MGEFHSDREKKLSIINAIVFQSSIDSLNLRFLRYTRNGFVSGFTILI